MTGNRDLSKQTVERLEDLRAKRLVIGVQIGRHAAPRERGEHSAIFSFVYLKITTRRIICRNVILS